MFKSGDTTDCSDYRPLTLLPVTDKLFALLLTGRLAATVALHDQKYAFRTARGTHNALFNLTSALRSRATDHPSFAVFLTLPRLTALCPLR